MKLLPLLAGALVAAATLTGSAVAMADEAPLDCAAALTAFQDASKAADAAKADDVAAADAKRADDAAADAAAAVDTARAAAVTGGVLTTELADKGAALRTERAAIVAVPAADRTDAQSDRLIVIDAKLKLIDAFLAAEVKAATAKAAAGSDADALRRKADLTNADALAAAAVKARAAATDACKGADGTPGVVFANCSEVRDAGKAPLGKDQPGYRLGLDSDGDGVACEIDDVPVPTKIDTGRAL